jgi:signal transduction histidine kinase
MITAIEEDDRQGIWVGWSDGTLARRNKENQEWKLYDISVGNSADLSEAIESIYQDQKGVLWFGVLEHGLFYWNKTTDRIQSAAARLQSIDPTFTPKVFLENDQYLWIGTLNKGIIQWHRPTGQTVRYSDQSSKDQSSLPSNQITGLALGSPGYLWVGTFDQGLCRLNTRTGTFSSLTEEEGLLSNRITSITPARENKLWIGSIKGITYYDKNNGDISNYPNKEFILDKELVHYCAASTNNSQLFGTLNGIVRVATDIESTPFQKSPLVTSRVITNKRSFALSPKDNIIELPYDENAVEINYALQQFAFFDDHQYEYRLIGLEEDWKKVGQRTLATYTNLSPGTYRFQLRSRTSQNLLIESENQVTLVINPAWYQTWLFRIFLLIIFSGTIGGLYYYRIISVQKRNRTLETLVAARTQELTDKSKFIEQQNLDIQRQNQKLEEAQSVIQQKNNALLLLNQGLEERVQQRTQELAATNEALVKSNDELDLFVYRAYHDVIGPIARIEGLCQVATLETKGDEIIDIYLKKLLTNCQTARTTLQKVLQIHHVRHHKIQKSRIKLRGFIQEIYDESLKLLCTSEASVNLTLECDPTICLETDTNLLKLILQGFIKNAIQYQKQNFNTGWVKIIVEHSESQEIIIKVEDNGEGIPSSLQAKLFTMFFRGHETKSGTGLDLYIAKLAAERLQGFLEYAEEAGNTQFSVAFSELKVWEDAKENTYAN